MESMKKSIINIILFLWYRVLGGFFRLFPIKNSKIIFVNFFGKGYGDNPKYVAEALLENTALSLDMLWIIKGSRQYDFPPQIQVVKRWSLSELYHLATARVWVDNSRKHFGVKKRKGQYYIQTWHGPISFKLIEKDIDPDIWYKASAQNDSKMIDALISGSNWQTELFRRCFWYDGEILEIGLPRNDVLANISQQREDIKKIVYDSFGLDRDRRIVLYVPTFRNNNSIDAYDMDYGRLLSALEKHWGGSWIVMIRLHPNIEKESDGIVYNDKIRNASQYSDINHLILVSDLLITDYSSCLFDAVYIEKPSIIYASDVAEYTKNRGFAFSLTDSPALLAENNEELDSVIKEFNLPEYIQKCRDFSQEYGVIHCGDASKKAAKWILDHISD